MSTTSDIAPTLEELWYLIHAFTTPTVTEVECAICFESCNINAEEEGLQLPCKHIVHDICLLTWSKEKSSCPMCRAENFALPERKYETPFEFGGDLLVSQAIFEELRREEGGAELVREWKVVEGEKWNIQGKFGGVSEGMRDGFF